MTPHARIQQHVSKARALALTEVQRLARKIMKANPTLNCYILAMGSSTFYETTLETKDECAKNSAPLSDDSRTKELDDFVDVWDRSLRLSGEGIRLDKHDGPVVTDW